MEIIINTEVFRGALQNIISVIDKSYTKPILSNFLIRTLEEEGEQDMVEFSATDYELSLIERVPAQVTEPGSVCINARRVYDIGREFQDESIRLRSTEQLWVYVTCGSSEMRLPSVEVGLYPQPTLETLSERITITTPDPQPH